MVSEVSDVLLVELDVADVALVGLVSLELAVDEELSVSLLLVLELLADDGLEVDEDTDVSDELLELDDDWMPEVEDEELLLDADSAVGSVKIASFSP